MALGKSFSSRSFAEPMPLLKKLFWVYFLLLIFEGALRKWILPQLSAPLLVIRDPIALLIIWEAYRTNKWPEKWSTVNGVLASTLGILCVLQMITGDNPWFAAAYGLRSYLLPFPVAFIMGENLDAEDLRKFGICTLWLLLPLTALEVAQYLAPADSFLNAGAYEGAEQITYAGAHVRASATFSFVTGSVNFCTLAAAFIFYGLVNEGFAKRWLLWAATFALILSVPVIGARTLAFELSGVVACAGIAAMCGVSQLTKSLKFAVPLLAVSFLVSLLPVFSEASNTLKQRFADASDTEGSVSHVLKMRTYGGIIDTVEKADFSGNPIGTGMGRGAAAISRLMQTSVLFAAGESEIDRAMNELGAVPGFAFMMFCFLLAAWIVPVAIARARDHDPLALLLFPLTLSSLLFAVLEQPTEQGFMVISLAFTLAAMRKTGKSAVEVPNMNPRWHSVQKIRRQQSRLG